VSREKILPEGANKKAFYGLLYLFGGFCILDMGKFIDARIKFTYTPALKK
jgi:hypothetical protein